MSHAITAFIPILHNYTYYLSLVHDMMQGDAMRCVKQRSNALEMQRVAGIEPTCVVNVASLRPVKKTRLRTT